MQQASAAADVERKERQKQEESQKEKKEAERVKKIREMKEAEKCANVVSKERVNVVRVFFPFWMHLETCLYEPPPPPPPIRKDLPASQYHI